MWVRWTRHVSRKFLHQCGAFAQPPRQRLNVASIPLLPLRLSRCVGVIGHRRRRGQPETDEQRPKRSRLKNQGDVIFLSNSSHWLHNRLGICRFCALHVLNYCFLHNISHWLNNRLGIRHFSRLHNLHLTEECNIAHWLNNRLGTRRFSQLLVAAKLTQV